MPAPEVDSTDLAARPALGHVNLMVDTLIANASLDEQVQSLSAATATYTDQLRNLHSLRAIIRSMLATSPPSVSASFVSTAQARLRQSAQARLRQSAQRTVGKQPMLFEQRERHGRIEIVASTRLNSLLSYIRSLYGAGLGFDSLDALAGIVRATSGLRWDADDRLANELAVIDADISQAIQSCREEYAGGNIRDIGIARAALRRLRVALAECRDDVESWDGEFPFSRGNANAECLQI